MLHCKAELGADGEGVGAEAALSEELGVRVLVGLEVSNSLLRGHGLDLVVLLLHGLSLLLEEFPLLRGQVSLLEPCLLAQLRHDLHPGMRRKVVLAKVVQKDEVGRGRPVRAIHILELCRTPTLYVRLLCLRVLPLALLRLALRNRSRIHFVPLSPGMCTRRRIASCTHELPSFPKWSLTLV